MADKEIYRVTFVCTGNRMRSVMAEAILKEYLKEHEVHHIWVESAGTMMLSGAPAASETIKVCADNGLDVSAHRSQQITAGTLYQSDIVLVMEVAHVEYIRGMYPEFEEKVKTLKGFETGIDEDIEDPIGYAFDKFESTFAEIKVEIERVIPVILNRAED